MLPAVGAEGYIATGPGSARRVPPSGGWAPDQSTYAGRLPRSDPATQPYLVKFSGGFLGPK